MKRQRLWTPEMWARAKEMLDDGYKGTAVDRALNIRGGATKARLDYERQRDRSRAARDQAIRRDDVVAFRCPDDVLAERDARKLASKLRDLTSQLCGDPPPGFSQLDKRTVPVERMPTLSAVTTFGWQKP